METLITIVNEFYPLTIAAEFSISVGLVTTSLLFYLRVLEINLGLHLDLDLGLSLCNKSRS